MHCTMGRAVSREDKNGIFIIKARVRIFIRPACKASIVSSKLRLRRAEVVVRLTFPAAARLEGKIHGYYKRSLYDLKDIHYYFGKRVQPLKTQSTKN